MAIEVKGLMPLLQVFDMPKAIQFYRRTLGFSVIEKSQPMSDDPDNVNWAMLQRGDAILMLNTAYDPGATPQAPDSARWTGHQDTCIYLACPDVDAAYQDLSAKGLNLPPPKITWYGMKQLYLQDPDGFGICFQWKA